MIVIDNQSDILEIDTPCRDIGGDQDGIFAAVEACEGCFTLRLGIISVDGPGGGERFCEFIATVFGVVEDDGKICALRRSARRSRRRDSLSPRMIKQWGCSMRPAVVVSGETRAGFLRIVSARETIFGVRVAEKRRDLAVFLEEEVHPELALGERWKDLAWAWNRSGLRK